MAEDAHPIPIMTFNINGKGKVARARNSVEAVLKENKPDILFAQEIPAPATRGWKFKKGILDQYNCFLTNNYEQREAKKAFRKEVGLAFRSEAEFYGIAIIPDQDKKNWIQELITLKKLFIAGQNDQERTVQRLFRDQNNLPVETIRRLIDPEADAMEKDIILQGLVGDKVLNPNLVNFNFEIRLLLDRCLGTYTNIRTRTCAAVLQYRETGKRILCVSWHGPEKGLKAIEDLWKKRQILSDVLVFIDHMSKKMQADGIIIGGDFNLRAEVARDTAANKGFKIKVDGVKKGRAIDYFLFRDQKSKESLASGQQLPIPETSQRKLIPGINRGNLDHRPITNIVDVNMQGGRLQGHAGEE